MSYQLASFKVPAIDNEPLVRESEDLSYIGELTPEPIAVVRRRERGAKGAPSCRRADEERASI